MELVPADQWQIYLAAMRTLRAAGVRFMLGGAFALACYTGRWRNTKDLDCYILPEDRPRAVSALLGEGFADFHVELPYDRRWIFRGTRQGFIVDLIWAMANQRAQVEGDWFAHAPTVSLRGESLQCLPAEELLWCKLYVIQRDRCDWPDLINLLFAVGGQLDWQRVLDRIGHDRAVLAGLLSLFSWVAPDKAANLPRIVQGLFPRLASRLDDSERERRRTQLLDSRPWFAAYQPEDQPMQL